MAESNHRPTTVGKPRKHKPRIAVVGSLNVDFTTTTPRVPGPGETLTATRLDVNAGGKGANQACACGRAAWRVKPSTETGGREGAMDVHVQMVGAVGAGDPYYDRLLKPTLEDSGVDVGGVKEVQGEQTGTATIIVDSGQGGENRILVVPGANHGGMEDLDDVWKRTRGGDTGAMPDVVVLQGEIPRATVLGIIEKAAKEGIWAVFNPAPVWREGVPRTALQGLGVLVVNETELTQVARSLGDFDSLLGGNDQKTTEEMEWSERVLTPFAEKFHALGVEIILVTLGARGIFYSMKAKKERKAGFVPGKKVDEVVDTTAAGDTFVGYFAVALAKSVAHARDRKDGTEFDVEEAVNRANAAAAKCVQRNGAMQSIPWGWE